MRNVYGGSGGQVVGVMGFGARVRTEREAQGLSQAKLVAKVDGLLQQTLAAIEKRDSATSEFAIRLADALGVSVRWLLDGTGRKEDLDWPFARVPRTRWDALHDDERQHVEASMNRAIDDCAAGLHVRK